MPPSPVTTALIWFCWNAEILKQNVLSGFIAAQINRIETNISDIIEIRENLCIWPFNYSFFLFCGKFEILKTVLFFLNDIFGFRFDTGFNSYSNYGKTNLFRRITAHQLSEERQEKFHKFKKFEHPEATLAKMKVLSWKCLKICTIFA